jgi:8-oxo-dGTP diphosphatase
MSETQSAAGPSATPAAKPTVLVVAGALYGRDGKVLIAQRPSGKHMAGRWEFPGGKVATG